MDYPSSDEMDLDDGWEMLDDEGFLVAGREFVSTDVGLHDKSLLVDVNYFICPPSPPPPRHHLIQGPAVGIEDVDVMPPWLEPRIEKNLEEEEEEEEKEIPVFSITLQKEIFLQQTGTLPKFVDIKAAVLPEIFHGGAAPGEERSMNSDEFPGVPKLVVGQEKNEGSSMMGRTLVEGEKSHGSGFTIWRWRIEGMGVLCSFGRMVAATAVAAAAATICVVVLGGNQSQKEHRQQQQQQKIQNQKIRFHVYADDSRIKEILHHAGRLNQTLSVSRGIPITGAQISFRN
ncbi:uncharacterized protein LOC116256841 [Nymphaea colorata]|nr:uncharacterized protein LOC116256841 [Nymphaea colorata]